MKYFIDTEFIEGFKKPLFGKRRHFIDLISIGIIAEDGRKLYYISCEYNYNDADDWVKENVILPIYLETVVGDQRNRHTVKNFHKFYGLKNSQIAKAVQEFIEKSEIEYCGYTQKNKKLRPYLINNRKDINIKFYGYYSDYDWVVFCSLFGRMIDLPKGFPMYCNDLKQYIDDAADRVLSIGVGTHTGGNKWYPKDCEEALAWVKNHPLFPKQINEHNALDDAKWNFELFKYLQTF